MTEPALSGARIEARAAAAAELQPLPGLAYRPAPESLWWRHAAFASWLLSHLEPVRCGGTPTGLAVLRALAARAGAMTEFDGDAAGAEFPIDLLVLDATEADDPAASLAAWRPKLRQDAVVLVHGATPQQRNALAAEAASLHISGAAGLPGANGLDILSFAAGGRPRVLWAMSAGERQAFLAQSAQASDAWIEAQWLREAEAEIGALRRQIDRLTAAAAAPPASRLAAARQAAATALDTARSQIRHAAHRGGARTILAARTVLRTPPLGLLREARAARREARRRQEEEQQHRALLGGSAFFDAAWYARRYPDVARSGLDPLAYFLRTGMGRGHETSPTFDGAWYLRRHPDVARAGTHPLLHYLLHGRNEGRAMRAAQPTRFDRDPGPPERRLGLQLGPATLLAVTVGMVVPRGLPLRDLRQAVAAATRALAAIGQSAPGRILLLGLGEPIAPEAVAEWPAAIVPPRHAKNAAAAHNRLMAMAYGGGADAYIAASAEGLLHPDAIVALMRAVRASGRRALAAAKRLPNPGRGLADPDALDAEWLCGCGLAIPKAVYAAIGGFDEDFAANGADIDFSWRARLQGFDLLNCPPATFLDRADREDPAEALIAGYRLARKWGRRNAAAKLARALDRRALPVPADVSDTTPRSGDPAVADFVFAKVARVRPW